MEYNIKILNSEDFDRLSPHEVDGVDVRDSLGVANVNTGRIFVRNTGVDELNKYLVNHEISHLFEDEVTDAEPGKPHIRHKKFRDAAAQAAPIIGTVAGSLIPGVGPIVGPAIGGALGSAGGRLISSEGDRNFRSVGGSALKGGIGGALSGFLGSKLFGAPTQSASTRALGSPITTTAGKGFTTSVGASSSPQLSQAQSVSTGPLSFLNRGLTNIKNLFGGGGGGGGGGPQGTIDTGQKSGGGIFDLFGTPSAKQILGAGSLGLGLFAPYPKVPDISAQTAELRNQINNNPLRDQAQGVLSGNLNREFSPLTDEEIQSAVRQIDEAEKRAEDQIRDVYRNIRPGSDEFTDTALSKELEDNRIRFAQARADAVAGRTRTAEDRFRGQQSSDIAQALGASDQEIQQLTQLANLDIGQIMTQLGLDFNQASLFKQTFLNLGTDLIAPQPSLSDFFG